MYIKIRINNKLMIASKTKSKKSKKNLQNKCAKMSLHAKSHFVLNFNVQKSFSSNP